MKRRILRTGYGLMLLVMLGLCPMLGQAQHMVKDMIPGSGGALPTGFITFNGKLYFQAYEETYGWELWVSDGTEAGTHLFKDIWPGALGSGPDRVTEYDGKLFFVAGDETHGRELWVSDGTEAGTRLLKDIWPGTEWSSPRGFTEYDGKLFFEAYDGTHGWELWVSDGTRAGTRLFKDIRPGFWCSCPLGFTVVDGKLFFAARDGIHGEELWVTDGTGDGTRLVKDIRPGEEKSYLGDLIAFGGKLYFSAYDGTHGGELWVSDGTEAGTRLFKDIRPGSEDEPPDPPGWFTVVDGKLFFAADDGTHGWELWVSDGTEAGTHLVKDIRPGFASLSPFIFTESDGALFFVADDGTHGAELWISDGTGEGTRLVKDIRPGIADSGPRELFALGGKVYFTAHDEAYGREVWVSDGTEAGTRLVKDIWPGSESSLPGEFTEYDGRLVFAATDGMHGYEPWVYDPSSSSADTTPPTCSDPRLSPGPFEAHTAVFLTAADPESGIASLRYDLTNAHGFYDAGNGTEGPFADGHTEALGNVASLTFGAEKLDPAQRSRIVVSVTNGAGLTATCDPVLTTLEGEQPLAFRLDQNYPNPFNPTTVIPFAVPEAAAVRMVIYDVLGREVATLVDRALEAGTYEATWDGTDGAGTAVAGGLYLCRLTAGAYTEVKTMTLLK